MVRSKLIAMQASITQLDVRTMQMDVRMQQMDVRIMQMDVRMRNGRLRNPARKIYPAPRFAEGVGVENPVLFPDYHHQFYSLRHPQTEHERQLLKYLCKFYDVNPEMDPELAVEQLEGILGLDEDQFGVQRVAATSGPPQAPSEGRSTVPFSETPERAKHLPRRPQRNPDSIIPDSTTSS